MDFKRLFEKRILKIKKDCLFEWKHKNYFIPLYLRFIVLLFLVFVFAYYNSASSICEEWGGYLQETDSFYKPTCIIPQNTIYSVKHFNNTLDIVFLPKSINTSKPIN